MDITVQQQQHGSDRSERMQTRIMGQEEYNLFLAVLFADEELEIYDYNRVIAWIDRP